MSLFPTNANYITNPVNTTINVNNNALTNVSTINGYPYNPSLTLSTFVTNPMSSNLNGSNYNINNIQTLTATTVSATGLTANGISYLYDSHISSIKDLNLISTTQALTINSGNAISINSVSNYGVTTPQQITMSADTEASYTSPIVRLGNEIDIISGLYTSDVYINGDAIFTTSTLTGISSINGQTYPPPSTDVSQWATFPAITTIAPPMDTNLLLQNNGNGSIEILTQNSGNIIIATQGGGTATIEIGSFVSPTMGLIADQIQVVYSTCTYGAFNPAVHSVFNGDISTKAIVGLSSINGYVYPPTGIPSFSISSITGVSSINGQAYPPPAINVSSLTGISSINGTAYPPPAWYNVTAGGNVNMGAYAITNTSSILSVPSESAFRIGGANLLSLVDFNDSGIYDGENPNIIMRTQDPTNAGLDNILFSTSTGIFMNAVEIEGSLSALGPITANAGVNVSSITFSDSTKQHTAWTGTTPTVKYLGEVTGGAYNPGNQVSWTITGNAPATTLYQTVPPSSFFTWTPSVIGGSNVVYFAPVVSGVYVITLDVGTGVNITSGDAGQTDTLYSAIFNMEYIGLGIVVPVYVGTFINVMKYEVLAGQDDVRNTTTPGTITAYLQSNYIYSIYLRQGYGSSTNWTVNNVSPTISFIKLG